MTVDASALRFPILVFRTGDVYAFRDAHTFTTPFIGQVRSGFYDKLELIDASGGTWRVTTVRERPTGLLKELVGALYAQRVEVEVTLEPAPTPLDLEAARARVLRFMRKGGTWEARGDQENGISAVQAAGDFASLVAVYARSAFGPR